MIEGPHGPEIDPDVEAEEIDGEGDGGQAEKVGCSSGQGIAADQDEGESEVYSSDEAPSKRKQDPKGGRKGRKAKGKPTDKKWKVLVRNRRTHKDALDLMVSLSVMSMERHQQNLLGLISCLCGPEKTSDFVFSSIPLPPSNAGLEILSTMSTQISSLIHQAEILDFRRMISLMQIALWLDWYVTTRYLHTLYADFALGKFDLCQMPTANLRIPNRSTAIPR
jgi:hypothetical protein